MNCHYMSFYIRRPTKTNHHARERQSERESKRGFVCGQRQGAAEPTILCRSVWVDQYASFFFFFEILADVCCYGHVGRETMMCTFTEERIWDDMHRHKHTHTDTVPPTRHRGSACWTGKRGKIEMLIIQSCDRVERDKSQSVDDELFTLFFFYFWFLIISCFASKLCYAILRLRCRNKKKRE